MMKYPHHLERIKHMLKYILQRLGMMIVVVL